MLFLMFSDASAENYWLDLVSLLSAIRLLSEDQFSLSLLHDTIWMTVSWSSHKWKSLLHSEVSLLDDPIYLISMFFLELIMQV